MNKGILVVVGVGLVTMAGCSRVAVTTEVKPDGSWTRSDVFTQSKSGMGSAQLSDVFVLPQGSGWTASKAVTKDEVKYTARLAAKGPAQFSRDIQVRRKNNGPVLVTNNVVVQEVSPGRWQYTETLHWDGAKPKELTDPPAEVIVAIRAALPPAVATEAIAKSITPGLIRGVWSTMFGPGQSLLPSMILQPDAAEHMVRQRLGKSVDRALGETLGSRLTPDERRATVKRLISGITQQTKDRNSPSGDSAKSDDGTDMPSLTFTLRPPGRITGSNGELDEFSGEVFWTLYPEAAALGDVVMKATWEAPPKTAGKTR